MLLSFFLVANLISFSQNEKEVENVQGICTLKGTLSSPEGGFESTDLIILISGSGPTDRNGNNAQMTNNSLKMISDDLVNTYGYCVLRYDKRSIAGSKIENFAQKNLSFDDFISDASSWVDKYKDNGLYKNIILAGHSQGSAVAIAAANKNKNVDAVISLAGAGRPIHSILKKQLSASLTIEMQGLVNAKLDTLDFTEEGISNFRFSADTLFCTADNTEHLFTFNFLHGFGDMRLLPLSQCNCNDKFLGYQAK
jgi:pimeloyl-ACP methyl ester carboxylesterase